MRGRRACRTLHAASAALQRAHAHRALMLPRHHHACSLHRYGCSLRHVCIIPLQTAGAIGPGQCRAGRPAPLPTPTTAAKAELAPVDPQPEWGPLPTNYQTSFQLGRTAGTQPHLFVKPAAALPESEVQTPAEIMYLCERMHGTHSFVHALTMRYFAGSRG